MLEFIISTKSRCVRFTASKEGQLTCGDTNNLRTKYFPGIICFLCTNPLFAPGQRKGCCVKQDKTLFSITLCFGYSFRKEASNNYNLFIRYFMISKLLERLLSLYLSNCRIDRKEFLE